MKRRKSQQSRFFVIKDRYGREWTTKEGLKFIRGICALDCKKYFYELNEGTKIGDSRHRKLCLWFI